MAEALTETPAWLAALDDEDLRFLQRFLLSSGSLKALAEQYGVSYPTVRARLDRLIAKATVADEHRHADALERQVRLLAAAGELAPAAAKRLLAAHREVVNKGGSSS